MHFSAISQILFLKKLLLLLLLLNAADMMLTFVLNLSNFKTFIKNVCKIKEPTHTSQMPLRFAMAFQCHLYFTVLHLNKIHNNP